MDKKSTEARDSIRPARKIQEINATVYLPVMRIAGKGSRRLVLTIGWALSLQLPAGFFAPAVDAGDVPEWTLTDQKKSRALASPTLGSGEAMNTKGSSTAPPADKPGVDWDLAWKGWDGLHYSLRGKRSAGWTLTDDQQTPAFPSLFTDRLWMTGKMGGRVDLDAAFFVNGRGLGPVANEVELRRWRFYAAGDAVILVPFSYSLNIMAVDNYRFVLDDVFLEFKRIPYIGNFKFGAFIPAMTLESSASSRDATFMEWGTPIQALAPRISSGWQMGRPFLNERATWSLGQFAQSLGTDVGDATKEFFRVIGRATWLPIADNVSVNSPRQRLLHLGLNLNYLRSGSAQIRYQSRPESYVAPFLADTGYIQAEDMKSFALEAAWVDGPWSVQGEFVDNFVSGDEERSFYGFYVFGSYFWTGESRRYDKRKGFFGRLTPQKNLSFDGEGYGALETAVRFSYLDLDNSPIRGGILRSVTAGINWYLHSNSKIRFNYVFARAGGGPQDGDLHIFETRFEFDF